MRAWQRVRGRGGVRRAGLGYVWPSGVGQVGTRSASGGLSGVELFGASSIRELGPLTEPRAGERGSVSAEFAVALPAVALVLTMCIGAVVGVATQVAVQDAAGEAARLAARGDDPAAALVRIRGAGVETWDAGELRCARVSAPVSVAGVSTAAIAHGESCALRDVE